MPDPYKPDDYSSHPGTDGGHPFLTEKGLRLQQSGRIGESYPIPMPNYQAPASPGPETPVPQDGSVVVVPSNPLPPVDPFDFEMIRSQPVHNVLPSQQFPNTELLGDFPLSDYYQSALVTPSLAKSLKAVGKLFIQVSSDPRQPLASGSAWIIGPSTIATAAHNLYDSTTRRWSRALAFYPGFDYYENQRLDSAPPSCRITGGYIAREYQNNPATNLDLAICYTDCNIGDIVGSTIEKRTIDRDDFFDNEQIAIVGYPAGSGFDFGKQMWKSVGSFLYGQRSSPAGPPAPVMATDFGGGASGCPWLVRDEANNRYFAVGVTSGHAKLRYARGEHNLSSLVSPYFSDGLMNQLADDQIFHEFSVT